MVWHQQRMPKEKTSRVDGLLFLGVSVDLIHV
jgi:hypothetical protein